MIDSDIETTHARRPLEPDAATADTESSFGDPLRRLRVITCKPDGVAARNHELEALWFELSEPTFGAVGLVAVPPMADHERVAHVAETLGWIGASVSREPVAVVDGFGVTPAEAECALEDLRSVIVELPQVVLVVQAPTIDPGSLPLLERCDRVVLLVELGVSKRREVDRLKTMLERCNVVGAVCLPKAPSPDAAPGTAERLRKLTARIYAEPATTENDTMVSDPEEASLEPEQP